MQIIDCYLGNLTLLNFECFSLRPFKIDECASNPCFVGVPCTDMLASFICGACPSEYTGNGENCTRLDGSKYCGQLNNKLN